MRKFRIIVCGVALAAGFGAVGRGWAADLFVPPPVTDKIALHEINVEQGAASLIETPCGTIMIDAGGREDNGDAHLLAYLKAYFAARPDLHNTLAAVYLTHTHIDHDEGLMDVAKAYRIGGFVYNGHHGGHLSGGKAANDMLALAAASSPQIPVVAVNQATFARARAAGYTNKTINPLSCAGTQPKIRVLSGAVSPNPGWTALEFKNDNSQSLVIRVDYGKSSFLFMGDLQDGAQKTLFKRYDGTGLLKADVYHVAHHGAENGTTDDTMTAISPRVAVMGVGPAAVEAPWTAWAYGHPRVRAIKALEHGVRETRTPITEPVASGVKTFAPETIDKAIYATGWDGDVVITATADGVITVDHHQQ